MFNLFLLWFGVLARLFRTRRPLLCGNLVFRQQLVVLKRRRPRPHLAASEAAALGIRPLLPGCLAGCLSTSSNCILICTCGAEPLGPIDNTTNNQEFRGRIVISIPPLGLKTRSNLARMKLWRGTASLMEPIGAWPRKPVEANSLKEMVGPCGLEPHTSTVSKTIDLLLLPKHLRVGFAVGVKVLMFTAFPSGFQFGPGDIPIRPAFLQHGTQVLP
jgi:hypothetical protein